jgi:hypothetical protein
MLRFGRGLDLHDWDMYAATLTDPFEADFFDLTRPGEVLVSRTVKDLVAGSGLCFHERGRHSLKGLQEPMDLYAASN